MLIRLRIDRNDFCRNNSNLVALSVAEFRTVLEAYPNSSAKVETLRLP